MLEKLPAMIDPGDLRLFTFQVRADDHFTFTRHVLGGQFSHLILIDQDNDRKAFRIPERLPDSDTRKNRYGQVARK